MGKCIMPQVFVIGGGGDEVPTDGRTHLGVRVMGDRKVRVLFDRTSGSTAAIVEWGDGTYNDWSSSIGAISTTHTYSQEGDYDITIYATTPGGKISTRSGYPIIGEDNDPKGMAGLLYCYFGDDIAEVGARALQNSSMLNKVKFNETSVISSTYLFTDSGIREVDLPAQFDTIGYVSGQSSFTGTKIQTLILRRQGVVTMSSSSIWGMLLYTTKVYVPDEWVDVYKGSANWSIRRGQIYPLSDKGVTHND